MFGTQETKKGFIQDRQRRLTFQTWQLTYGKRFLVRILDLSKKEAKLLSYCLVRFYGEQKTRKPNYRADANSFNNTGVMQLHTTLVQEGKFCIE